MELSELLSWASDTLTAAGIDTPTVDAELLAAHVLGISRAELKQRTIFGFSLADDIASEFKTFIKQRANRVPLQHITGRAPFRYLDLEVGPGVFIPRPETEVVAGAGIDWLKAAVNHRALKNDKTPAIAVDLCTGSGSIAIAIATECPKAQVYAVELNEITYNWASKNIRNLAPNVVLIHGDALTALPELNGSVDLVISNPPYLAPDEIPLAEEVAVHDPELALYGKGDDGLEVPLGIVQTAIRLLKPGGLLVIEHGDTQAEALAKAIKDTNKFKKITKNQDLTGRDRYLTAERFVG